MGRERFDQSSARVSCWKDSRIGLYTSTEQWWRPRRWRAIRDFGKPLLQMRQTKAPYSDSHRSKGRFFRTESISGSKLEQDYDLKIWISPISQMFRNKYRNQRRVQRRVQRWKGWSCGWNMNNKRMMERRGKNEWMINDVWWMDENEKDKKSVTRGGGSRSYCNRKHGHDAVRWYRTHPQAPEWDSLNYSSCHLNSPQNWVLKAGLQNLIKSRVTQLLAVIGGHQFAHPGLIFGIWRDLIQTRWFNFWYRLYKPRLNFLQTIDPAFPCCASTFMLFLEALQRSFHRDNSCHCRNNRGDYAYNS